MPEAGRRTLLDMAITASAAVVPVLLVVLLLVAAKRPAHAPMGPERHVSVRQMAALKTFEQAIVRRDGIKTEPATGQVLLHGIPQCRQAWGERMGVVGRLKRWIAPDERRSPSAADLVATQLTELDRSLRRFSTADNRRVEAAVGLDTHRWMDAAELALRTSLRSPEYPDRRFALQCADLVAAMQLLMRADGRMLDALAWRGSTVASVVARWRAEQVVQVTPVHVARNNPWSDIPGCVYMGSSAGGRFVATHFVAGQGSQARRVCALPEVAGLPDPGRRPVPLAPGARMAAEDGGWSVPPSLDVMLRALEPLQRPSASLYRAYTEAGAPAAGLPTGYRYGPNRVALDGAHIDVGFSVDLTIDPLLQAIAQKTASCYTGRQDACESLSIRRRDDGGRPVGHQLLEQAVVRMAAVAIIDVASGRIEALAGALSPCTRQEYDGPGRASNCDRRLPYPIVYRPDALLNQAVFHDAMPASLIKPIMAAGFLSDPQVGARWLAAEQASVAAGVPQAKSLRGELARSDSARFLDRMFCAEQGFAACERPARVQAAALALGWSEGCTGQHDGCGKRDLLFGRAPDGTAEGGLVRPLATMVPYGRLLTEPAGGRIGAPFGLMSADAGQVDQLRRCAAGADGVHATDDDWEKCRGASVSLVAEGWGQGHARASTLGVAGMMAAVAAAANGQSKLRRPHLVRAVRGVGRSQDAQLASAVLRWSLAQPQPNELAPAAARVVLDGLSYSHRAGSALRACEQVFGSRDCRQIDWIAGKTGTPSFPNDDRSLDALARLCTADNTTARREPACASLKPYKWYAAAYKADPRDTHWTKAIAVLAERNWLQASGRIQGAGDHGPNPAAEIAFQVAVRQRGLLNGAKK